MSSNAPVLENPLTSAVQALDDISRDRELLASPIDAGSVTRMAVHITNINSSVLASTDDHVNASKRLNDFAVTLARMAKNSQPPNPLLTDRMSAVANHLRFASKELAGATSIPPWQA